MTVIAIQGEIDKHFCNVDFNTCLLLKLLMSNMLTILMKKKVYNFTVIIEKDEDGFYIGSVPALKGCHTQGKTMDELMKNIKEVIELCLEVESDIPQEEFVGIQQITVSK